MGYLRNTTVLVLLSPPFLGMIVLLQWRKRESLAVEQQNTYIFVEFLLINKRQNITGQQFDYLLIISLNLKEYKEMKVEQWLLFFVLSSIVLGQEQVESKPDCTRLNYLPMPKEITCGKTTKHIEDPCQLLYLVKTTEPIIKHIQELITFQHTNTFHCKLTNVQFGGKPINSDTFAYRLQINIKDPSVKSVFSTIEQSYKLQLNEHVSHLNTDTYVGFVRGLETFLQAIQCPKAKYKSCNITNLPQQISDQPAFSYRGLLIDTARHFLPVKTILQTIDALMYNKMNVLHWHIVDEDSFPLILRSHPEIAKYAAFSQEETYTAEEAKEIVEYAMKRGVRIVPQMDTPGHAASWGLAPQNAGISCRGSSGFIGPLDITLDRTYKLVAEVLAQIFQIFPDPLVHLGGDQIVLACLANKTEFLIKQQINEVDLKIQYRKKQRALLKSLNSSKKFIYWQNAQLFGKKLFQQGDVAQWWGIGLPYSFRTNQLIISEYGSYYLDTGVGNYFGVAYGNYFTWYNLYNTYFGLLVGRYPFKKNVLGGEMCLWSELSNQYVHHMKIWIRGSSVAQRLWNTANFKAKPDFLERLTAHQRLMNRRGIPTSSATSQQCESHPEYC